MDEGMLLKMLKDIAGYKDRNRGEIMEKCVNERLEKSLKTYYDSLIKSLDYLETKNALRLLKNVSKL